MPALPDLLSFFWRRPKPPAVSREQAAFRDSLARQLDYLDFIDGVCPLVDGRVAVALRVWPFAADALTTTARNNAYLAIRKALAQFPEQTTFQFWYRNWYASAEDIQAQLGREAPSGSPEIDALAARREAFLTHLAERGFLYEPRCYLFATFSPSSQWRLATRRAGGRDPLGPKGLRPIERRAWAEHARVLEDLAPGIDLIRSGLAAAGVRSDRVSDDDLATLIFRQINPNWRRAGKRRIDRAYALMPWDERLFRANPSARPASPREQLVYSDVFRRPEHLEVDGVLTKTLHLKKLPEHAVPGMIEVLTSGLGFEFSLSVQIEILDKSTELAEIRARKKWHDSLRNAWLFGGRIKLDTAESDLAYQYLEALVYDTIEGRDRPLNAGLAITFEAPTETELKRRANQIVTQLRCMHSAEPLHDKHRPFEMWRSTLPGHGHSMDRLRRATQSSAAALVPVFGRWRGTTGWPVERCSGWPLIAAPNDRGELVSVDPFQLPSRHMAVWGATGSGKSVAVNQMLARHLRYPEAMAIVFDATGTPYTTEAGIGESCGSFERLSKAFGGEYVPVGLAMPNFNPFALRLPESEIDEHVERDREGVPHFAYQQCLLFLESLLVEGDRKELDKKTRGVLLRVLRSLMVRRPDPEDPPRMDQFLKELHAFAQQRDDAGAIARGCFDSLVEYGPDTPLGSYLSRRDRVFDPRKRFIVFDLKNLPEFGRDAKSVLLLVTNFASTEMQKRSNRERRKMLVGDELHSFIDGPMGQAFAMYAATLRKHNGMICYVSQDVTDVSATSHGARLIANTAIKMIFSIEDRLAAYAAQYGLTDADCDVISSLGNATVAGATTATRAAFIKVREQRSRLSLPLDPVEYYLFTSNSPDVRLMRALQPRLGTPGRDIGYLEFFERVAARYPPGWTDRNDVRAEIDRLTGTAQQRKERP